MITQTPRGTKDIFTPSIHIWQYVEEVIRETAARFVFEEIRTPIFEHTELFLRGVGENTDIVQKEMYTFEDKGGRSLSLRPEITAGAARAFVEHKMYAGTLPIRLYYIGPNFRYEKPGAGRWRQFHQFGAEIYGAYSAAADAELIALADMLFSKLGIRDGMEIRVNSLGNAECRARYNSVLKSFLSEHFNELCETCQMRFARNPMRVLDCKSQNCQALLQEAPVPLNVLGDECRKHLESTQQILSAMGITAVLDSKIVRGLDYYTRTVFEFIDTNSNLTVCGGGRYDNLIEECGGPATGAVGFALGLERLIMMLEGMERSKVADVFIGSSGAEGFIKAHSLANELREAGIAADADISGRGVKAQMKYANKTGARFSMIIGENELAGESVKIKDMQTGQEIEKSFSEIKAFLEGV